LKAALRGFRRQALHAYRLQLAHPVSGKTLTWEAPLPNDMLELIGVLREDAGLRV
jgi:23S rRNA pseudouridine1911/1915/1917 synthase